MLTGTISVGIISAVIGALLSEFASDSFRNSNGEFRNLIDSYIVFIIVVTTISFISNYITEQIFSWSVDPLMTLFILSFPFFFIYKEVRYQNF